MTAKVQLAAGIQVRVRAAEAGNAANVLLRSHAAKAKKLSPSKVAATSTTMKAANRILIAKMQTVKLSPREGRSVQEAIVRTAVAGIAAVEADGIAEVAVVAQEVVAIVVLVVAEEIAATAKNSN